MDSRDSRLKVLGASAYAAVIVRWYRHKAQAHRRRQRPRIGAAGCGECGNSGGNGDGDTNGHRNRTSTDDDGGDAAAADSSTGSRLGVVELFFRHAGVAFGVARLVGTSHLSLASVRLARRTVRQSRPLAVAVELCREREHLIERSSRDDHDGDDDSDEHDEHGAPRGGRELKRDVPTPSLRDIWSHRSPLKAALACL